ncbi:MAG: PEP-CTERM sorting domain-containing protein [Planctomycetaceae bacterium]|nr:PEP-CTERM sorting domain-containing protein [Planctomycetaceae bacterium]
MRFITVAVACVALCAASANAGITGYTINNDGDGAINCALDSWIDEGEATYSMTIVGDQFWSPGHMVGEFVAPEDPSVRVRNIINNDTTFAWTSYRVNVYMNKVFTISTAPADLLVYGPAGWTATLTQQAAPIVGGQYMAIIDYTGAAPLAINDTLDFGYKMSFLGSIQYCQEMIPIPEPATMSLLAIGGLAALLRRKRN